LSWPTILALAAALGVDCTSFTISPKNAPAPSSGRPKKDVDIGAAPLEPAPAKKTTKRKEK
jgi:hypothetical protein